MKVKIGDKVICKLDNKEYTIISTTTSSDGVGKSSFRIKMENKNKNTIEESFQIYKYNKENYIKEVANLYKKWIPSKLYDAMCNYEVEMED